MNNVKKALIVIALAVNMSVLVGCGEEQTGQLGKRARQQWEYKVVPFSREESRSMATELKALGDDGWEYAGPLANNGINGKYVAFKRPK